METLNIRNEGGVRIVELNRPDSLNAINGPMIDDLTDAFVDAAGDDSVKVLLLTGAGRVFWAGADLKEMGRSKHQPRHTFQEMMDALIDFPKPFLVAVHGVGVGIGATICGLADYVLMADDARLRCPFSTLGLVAEAASTVTFPRLMGRQRASWFLLSAEWMGAEACLEAGLVAEILPPDGLLDGAMERANTLAALPLASLMATKALMMDPLREQMKASAIQENKKLASLQGQPANKEALTAFMEKRAPDFTGL
ncbi:MAG: enoyl-CoA hydratase/isomerase family protein [Pseudomonadales bacterium]|nr:enoyl-CoA hydratase/isomerase family protein [Pseudomonadales bacterium]